MFGALVLSCVYAESIRVGFESADLISLTQTAEGTFAPNGNHISSTVYISLNQLEQLNAAASALAANVANVMLKELSSNICSGFAVGDRS